jgi:hypothetical protein
MPNALTIGGVVVAALLIATFLSASWWVMVTANDPPLLADPAPTDPPALICGKRSSGTTQSSTSSGNSAPSGITTNGAIPGSTTGKTSMTSATGSSDAAGATASPVANPEAAAVTCSAGEVAYAPQFRGGYDPHTRLMALLAVVVPLLTTIVAFYFGQRAGAGAGEAEKHKIMAQVMGADSQNSPELADLQRRIREANRI